MLTTRQVTTQYIVEHNGVVNETTQVNSTNNAHVILNGSGQIIGIIHEPDTTVGNFNQLAIDMNDKLQVGTTINDTDPITWYNDANKDTSLSVYANIRRDDDESIDPMTTSIIYRYIEPPIIPESPHDYVFGVGSDSYVRDAPFTGYWNHSHSILMMDKSKLVGIPDGATITRLEFQYEKGSTGTYNISGFSIGMFQVPTPVPIEFPGNLKIDGSSDDAAWNTSRTNTLIQCISNKDLSLVKTDLPDVDAPANYSGFDLDEPYTNYNSNLNLCYYITQNGSTDSYTSWNGLKAHGYTAGYSDTDYTGLYAVRDSGGAYNDGDTIGSTTHLRFVPNVRIHFTTA